MRRIVAMGVALGLVMSSLALAESKEKAAKAEPKTTAAKAEREMPADKLSYAIGMEIGGFLKGMPGNVNMESFIRGARDVAEGKPTLLTEEEALTVKKEFAQKLQEEAMQKMKALAEENRKKGDVFLTENGKKDGVTTTKSGLQYEVLKQGDGATPKETDKVKVHYRGTLVDGTEFDSSYDRGEPAVFPVEGVIPGWTEALKLMKVGGKYRVAIPSKLAYGERGMGGPIGPNSTLVFEVELLGIQG